MASIGEVLRVLLPLARVSEEYRAELERAIEDFEASLRRPASPPPPAAPQE